MLDEGNQVFTMTKEELMDNYPIIRGRREDLPLLKEGCPMRVRGTSDGFETILEKYDITYWNAHDF
ncbi:MAG TPA: hypothetical protein GX002_09355 [Clostridiales bacterium]|jgi:hypothetical protein|nr:hypothetical protein [Clostridiales bacterium]